MLIELAKQTGGAAVVFRVGDPISPQVAKELEAVRAQVQTVYRLELSLRRPVQRTEKVQVKIGDARLRKKTHLYFPTAIQPCQ